MRGSARTREEILDVATSEFAAHGSPGSRVDEIAAGIQALQAQLRRRVAQEPQPGRLDQDGAEAALVEGRAVASEIVNGGWRTRLGRDVPDVTPEAAGRLYFLGGPDALEWRRLVAIASRALRSGGAQPGRRRRMRTRLSAPRGPG